MVKILLFVNLGLLIALVICILIIKKQCKNIKAYKDKINHLEESLRIKNEIKKKVDKFYTEDDIVNFNNTLSQLQEYSKK